MAIRQRKDRGGRWQVYYRNPLTGKQETALYGTKKEAQKADDEIRLRLKWEPESFKPQEVARETKEVLTFEAVTDLYLKYRQFSRVSLTNLLYAIKPFMPIIGPYDITQIGRKELIQALNLIDNGKVKAATVHRKFGIIKAITGHTLNLRSSVTPYIMMSLTCMGLKNGLFIYMLRQYFKNVPESLEEAAYVDGCGTMHTFVKIMLPDAMPTIASCFLFSFVWQWTDLFYARNFLTRYKLYATELSTMVSEMGKYFSADQVQSVVVSNGRSLQLVSIAVLICCIPLIILYIFTQRTFVESLVMTGSKE